MRSVVVVLVTLVAAGCTIGGGGEGAGDGPSPPSSDPTSYRPVSGTEACAEVRAGIDAFNEGDLEETVRRFEAARPLAEQLVAEGEDAGLLLEAIEYYASLPAEEYLEASPSPEFQRSKAVTLMLCAYGSPTPEPGETELPA